MHEGVRSEPAHSLDAAHLVHKGKCTPSQQAQKLSEQTGKLVGVCLCTLMRDAKVTASAPQGTTKEGYRPIQLAVLVMGGQTGTPDALPDTCVTLAFQSSPHRRWGSIFHWQVLPAAARDEGVKILSIVLRSLARGRPVRAGSGSSGSMNAYCWSVS
jgi:hypothetical protein